MTSLVEFVEAAHKQAEEIARALRDDLWWADQADRIDVYNAEGVQIAGAEVAVHQALVAVDPAAVLRRIAKEREILAKCQEALTEEEQLREYCGSDIAQAVIRALAEGWGWTEEKQ